MVTSYAQLLQRRYQKKLDTDADEFIGFMVDGARRMQALIEGLLAYSRVGSRGRAIEAVTSKTAVDEAIRNLKSSIDASGAKIEIGDLPVVAADHMQLVQLFQNLISNAVKFRTGDSPRVEVAAERGEEEWIFTVRDNGIGIDARYAEHVFTIFQRLHSQEEYPGTVIGLAVCRKIVERHGGRIWVESGREGGSAFRFTIPARRTSR